MSGKAKKIKAELLQIKEKHPEKLLVPKNVWKFAKAHKRSELYNHFDWDVKEAAENWWTHQAKNLIRIHVAVYPNMDEPTRIFISLKDDRQRKDGGYRGMEEVLSDKKLKKLLLKEALEELQVFQRKYNRLNELASVFKAIDDFEESFE